MRQIARNATMEGCCTLRDCRYLLHDRDTKYTQSFRANIVSVEPLVLPTRSPNLNAYAELFECNTMLTLLELLLHEPIHVGASPRLLARIMSSEPKHERGDLLALALEVFLRCLTGAREISHSFMPLIGYPDRGQFLGAQ